MRLEYSKLVSGHIRGLGPQHLETIDLTSRLFTMDLERSFLSILLLAYRLLGDVVWKWLKMWLKLDFWQCHHSCSYLSGQVLPSCNWPEHMPEGRSQAFLCLSFTRHEGIQWVRVNRHILALRRRGQPDKAFILYCQAVLLTFLKVILFVFNIVIFCLLLYYSDGYYYYLYCSEFWSIFSL